MTVLIRVLAASAPTSNPVVARASVALLGLEVFFEKHCGFFDMFISDQSESEIQSYQSEHDRARTFLKLLIFRSSYGKNGSKSE